MALQKATKTSNNINFKFLKEGDSIKGYYLGQVEKTINDKPAVESTYHTKEGVLAVLGQSNILNQIKNNNITPGTYVEIVFTGMMQKLKGGRTMKMYDVSYDTDNQLSENQWSASDDGEVNYEGDNEAALDEVTPPRPSKPLHAATVDPSKARGLLNGRKV